MRKPRSCWPGLRAASIRFCRIALRDAEGVADQAASTLRTDPNEAGNLQPASGLLCCRTSGLACDGTVDASARIDVDKKSCTPCRNANAQTALSETKNLHRVNNAL